MKQMVIMIGIARSGKSTLSKIVSHGAISIVSADSFRVQLLGSKGDMRRQGEIWGQHSIMLENLLMQNKPVIVDNTNLTKKHRASIIELGKKYGYKIIGMFVDTPYDILVNRANKSEFPVDVIDRMTSSIQHPVKEEGFDHIYTVSGV